MSKPIVTIKQGKIQGAVVKSVLGPSFNAFYEIPFAAPPVGDLRFKVIDHLDPLDPSDLRFEISCEMYCGLIRLGHSPLPIVCVILFQITEEEFWKLRLCVGYNGIIV